MARSLLAALPKSLRAAFPLMKGGVRRGRSVSDIRKSITDSLKRKARFKFGEDYSLPVLHIPQFIEFCHSTADNASLDCYIWGHAGDGNLHVNLLYNNNNEEKKVLKIIGEFAAYVVKSGGSLSGEHGLGRIKRHLLPLEQSENLINKQRSIKNIFDPNNILNRALFEN